MINHSYELSDALLFKKHQEIIIPFIQNIYNEILKCDYKSNSNDFIINQIDRVYDCSSKNAFKLISMNENKLKNYSSPIKHIILHYLKLRADDIIRSCLYKNNIEYECKGRMIKCKNSYKNITQNLSLMLSRLTTYNKVQTKNDNYKTIYNGIYYLFICIEVVTCNDYVNKIEKEFFELLKSKSEKEKENFGILPFDKDIFK